jgi:hypothetical protein
LKDRYTKLTLFKVYEYDYKSDERSQVISEYFPLSFLFTKNVKILTNNFKHKKKKTYKKTIFTFISPSKYFFNKNTKKKKKKKKKKKIKRCQRYHDLLAPFTLVPSHGTVFPRFFGVAEPLKVTTTTEPRKD